MLYVEEGISDLIAIHSKESLELRFQLVTDFTDNDCTPGTNLENPISLYIKFEGVEEHVIRLSPDEFRKIISTFQSFLKRACPIINKAKVLPPIEDVLI